MGISKRYKRRWRRQIINGILCLTKNKVVGFYPENLRWGSFEKDDCLSSVKDRSDGSEARRTFNSRDAKGSIDSAH